MENINELAYEFLMTERNNLYRAEDQDILKWVRSKGIVIDTNEKLNNLLPAFRIQKFTKEQYKNIYNRWLDKTSWMEHRTITSVGSELTKVTPNVPSSMELVDILKEIGIKKELALSRVTRYVFKCHVLCPDQIED